MEDKIDKLYDLVEKMYVDLKGDINGVKSEVTGLKDGILGINKRLDKIELTQEQMQSKLELIAEVQVNHFEGQDRVNKQVLNKLDRLETATLENEAEIYNLKKAK